ncbi:AbrB/MazE/SpoVT family DNA-binding domain-containing protein [Phytoactinopolyspora alkaliphila]|uniref:AbrB/MazE/SpoVT family DNA-binding domain-containing protein n=1 Tax=Phytoactinopolyspora alkaliphila TaxID=1783498 RepID=A0A6N9YNV9_9ACTN|nr:AbrB/MazE/SpoVT family DNA-binding domain-containing protein [Phytoactinopolyspora alkaliphila]NED96528.1 AbrB/MazE/SpoVT family DNA-binding domain-containing protein [Phytoactinopolyspora alkaliphila]
MSAYTLKLSSNGQVSIPAAVRRRWNATHVLVIDKGDRIIVRPVPDDPIESVIGKYAGGESSDELRRIARAEEAEREHAR